MTRDEALKIAAKHRKPTSYDVDPGCGCYPNEPNEECYWAIGFLEGQKQIAPALIEEIQKRKLAEKVAINALHKFEHMLKQYEGGKK